MSKQEEQQQLANYQSMGKSQILTQVSPDRPRQFQTRNQNKNEEDCEHIQMTSPTQNLVSDLSNIKCSSCGELERKLGQREHELQNQRKKNVKYLKIINTKVDKEKELQKAYYEIAKELKKRIDAASSYELQNVINHEKQEKQVGVMGALEKLREQIAEKDVVIQRLREKQAKNALNLLEYEKIAMDQVNKESTEKCSKLHLTLEANILNIKLWNLIMEDKEKSQKSMHLDMENSYERPYLPIQHELPTSSERIEKDQIEVEKFIFEKQQELKSFKSKSREEEQQEEYNTVRSWKSESFYTVNNSKVLHSYLQNHFQEDNFLNSIQRELQKQRTSFYSIPEQEAQGLEFVQISNVSMKNSQSNVENDRKSQKQILSHLSLKQSQRNSQNQRQLLLQRYNYEADIVQQLDIERQKASKFAQCVKFFVRKLNDRFNYFGAKYKITYELPATFTNHVESPKSDKPVIDSESIQHVFSVFALQLQKLIKSQKKEYQKMLNDRQLTLHDLQNKYIQLQNEKKELQRKNDNYLMHKSVLQVKLLELQERLQARQDGKESPIIKSELAIHYRKKVNTLFEQKNTSQQTQCEILPSSLLDKSQTLQTTNNKYIQALSYIPQFLNEMLASKEIKVNYGIDFNESLEKQLDFMLRKSLSQLQASTGTNDFLVRRIRSASLNLSPKDSKKSQEDTPLRILQEENQNLKNYLKQRTDEVFRLNEKITLQKMQKANSDRHIQLLKKQISSLKNQLLPNQCFSPIAVQAKQPEESRRPSRSQSSEFQEYQQKKQYNNLYWDRDLQVKQLKEKIEEYEVQLKKYRAKAKKKQKIIYLNQ